jgi:hypothetical protein
VADTPEDHGWRAQMTQFGTWAARRRPHRMQIRAYGWRVLGQSARWIREPWPSTAAGGRVEGGADPAVVGGVEGEAGGDDLVDAVEDVVGEVDAGGGEL